MDEEHESMNTMRAYCGELRVALSEAIRVAQGETYGEVLGYTGDDLDVAPGLAASEWQITLDYPPAESLRKREEDEDQTLASHFSLIACYCERCRQVDDLLDACEKARHMFGLPRLLQEVVDRVNAETAERKMPRPTPLETAIRALWASAQGPFVGKSYIVSCECLHALQEALPKEMR